jgi:hypothetical protein
MSSLYLAYLNHTCDFISRFDSYQKCKALAAILPRSGDRWYIERFNPFLLILEAPRGLYCGMLGLVWVGRSEPVSNFDIYSTFREWGVCRGPLLKLRLADAANQYQGLICLHRPVFYLV